MTPEQKVLVQESFAHVVPLADHAAVLFYDRLFELDPSLRPLFKNNMTEQRGKMMDTLAVAVAGMDRLDEIVPALQALGRRHAHYGVTPEAYNTVGTALLWMLEQVSGAGFTPEVRDAWVEIYTLLAETMQQAAAMAARPAHSSV